MNTPFHTALKHNTTPDQRYHRTILWWILATAIGGILSVEIFSVIVPLRGGDVFNEQLTLFDDIISSFPAYVVLGLLQMLVLRTQLPSVRWWWAATAIGGGMVDPLLRASAQVAGFYVGTCLITMSIVFGLGFGLGFGQWLVLRTHARDAYRWIMLSSIGLPLSIALVGSIAAILRPLWMFSTGAWLIDRGFMVFSWACYGLIMGSFLVRWLWKSTEAHTA